MEFPSQAQTAFYMSCETSDFIIGDPSFLVFFFNFSSLSKQEKEKMKREFSHKYESEHTGEANIFLAEVKEVASSVSFQFMCG